METREIGVVDYLILTAAILVGVASVALFFFGLPWAAE
jgi:hypothetical protein